eukprot:TRINITY_DN27072_c0_g1_i1.p1 TRINITY_DN27072_c0_g1~~TRINITY_DN27072_c0_g1_i1.p1  ORF type:complete len:544 (+),score=81.28 TRINITY_DN27072_c0_g1_i1:92-1723(+)
MRWLSPSRQVPLVKVPPLPGCGAAEGGAVEWSQSSQSTAVPSSGCGATQPDVLHSQCSSQGAARWSQAPSQCVYSSQTMDVECDSQMAASELASQDEHSQLLSQLLPCMADFEDTPLQSSAIQLPLRSSGKVTVGGCGERSAARSRTPCSPVASSGRTGNTARPSANKAASPSHVVETACASRQRRFRRPTHMLAQGTAARATKALGLPTSCQGRATGFARPSAEGCNQQAETTLCEGSALATPPRNRALRSVSDAASAVPTVGQVLASCSSLLATPEPRMAVSPHTPPPAPCIERERRELDKDLNLALECRSEAHLSMTLLRSHSLHSPRCRCNHPLHEAINRRHVPALSMLLDHGRHDLEELCCGTRPLLQAARISVARDDFGHRMAQLLLQRGAVADAVSEDGSTALHAAASRGCMALAEMLLEHGANPNGRGPIGETALHLACWQRRSLAGFGCQSSDNGLLQSLLAHGADPRLLDRNERKPADYLDDPALEGCRKLLEREEHWLRRRPLILARGRGMQEKPLVCKVPDLIFRAIARYL